MDDMKKKALPIIILIALTLAACTSQPDTSTENNQPIFTESDQLQDQEVEPEETQPEPEPVEDESEVQSEMSDNTPVTLHYDFYKRGFIDDEGGEYAIVAQDILGVYFESYVVAGSKNDYVLINPTCIDNKNTDADSYTAYSLEMYADTYEYDKSRLVDAIRNGMFYTTFGHLIINTKGDKDVSAPLTTYIPSIAPILSAAEEVLDIYYSTDTVKGYRVIVDEITENGEKISITCLTNDGYEDKALGVILEGCKISEKLGETMLTYETGRAERVTSFYEYSNGKTDSETVKISIFK